MNLKRTALLGLKIVALTLVFGLFVGWMLARRHPSLAVCASPQRSELPA